MIRLCDPIIVNSISVLYHSHFIGVSIGLMCYIVFQPDYTVAELKTATNTVGNATNIAALVTSLVVAKL